MTISEIDVLCQEVKRAFQQSPMLPHGWKLLDNLVIDYGGGIDALVQLPYTTPGDAKTKFITMNIEAARAFRDRGSLQCAVDLSFQWLRKKHGVV